jgi:alpha/beta superfamily hydrolase
MNALSRFEAASFAVPRLKRALVLGRDGIGPENALVNALRASGAEVLTDPGRGWGIALARPQSALPEDIFDRVGTWLAAEEEHCELGLAEPTCERAATLGQVGERVHEEAIVFSGAGQQLFAVISEPVDVPAADCTLILFNAGAIRRIGPNRMWTEAARRWASAGVPALRVDLEGIGDAAGDGSRYVKSDEPFYTRRLVEQARAALDLAVERGLPSRFVVAGLCSGAFWAFQLALSDPRVEGVIALNPRMLVFDRNVEGGRELRKLHRILTPAGFKTMLLKDHKLERLQRVGRFLLEAPARMVRRESQASINELAEAFSRIRTSGKHLHLAFSGDEPLYEELRKQGIMAQLEQLGARLCELPFKSHTLKPLAAQVAAHAVIDEGVACTLQAASKIRPAQARRRPQARRKRSEPRFDTAVPFRDMPSTSIA